MTRFHLNFNRAEALEYQMQIANELICNFEKDLTRLQLQATGTMRAREMVAEYPNTWKPLFALMKPTPGQAEADKYLEFHKKVVSFLKAKREAINMVMTDQKDPKVSKALKN